MICGGTGCHASKSLEIKNQLESKIAEKGLQDKAIVVETGCNGFCAQGPVMNVFPGGIFYQFMKPEDAEEIIEEHVLRGQPVKRLMYHEPETGQALPYLKDIPFFAMQEPRVLRNRGLIAAEKIEEYIGTGGYEATSKALTQMAPQEIIGQVKESGLRGRGGAGFPTGLKWEFAARSEGDVKFVLCNADEGDPGAFMDRSVLEADPHAVIEGMIIAAKAIGAHQGYIYCRAEYPLAVKRLNIAIEQAREYGLLGQDILESGFDFDLEVYQGAGAFVCGEETALMNSIEGKRGMPRPRPPFPALSGLWQRPTVLNNVETYANVAQIILNGGGWYASIGTEKSKGTKVFALTGKVKNSGLVEVPMGIPLGTIIHDIGGGIPKGKKFKAVQLGGPSGGCIPVQHLNAPVDYESIVELGAIMGSGGMIVVDEDTCMVDMARYFLEFIQDESCGKCTPCREGAKRMLEILERICQGQGREGDIELLEELSVSIKEAALCGLGQTAPNPVLSTLRYFRDEYEAHIHEKRCPAGACEALFNSPCQNACPVGMDVPAYIALVRAGRLDDAYKVLLKTNPFPSVCGRVCDHQCESKCRRSSMDEAVSIKYLKRFITDNASRPVTTPVPISRSEKIAVIGAGPSGLTAARDLALRGYAVTVFEELPEPGGMLRYGIPAYRLPRETLKAEIDAIFNLGVKLNCRTRVGRDISWERIKEEFDVIYVAVGAHRSFELGAEGGDLDGVIGAVEFLRQVNLGHKPPLGKRVAVIGGGNAAIDAARSALRLGAKEVSVLYRRLREDMPAQEEEILAAEEEGVQIQYLVAPIKFVSDNGRVQKVVCQQMSLSEFDSSGRRRPVPVNEADFSLNVDQVILAIGQRPELGFLEKQKDGDIEVTKRGLIKIKDKTRNRASEAMIFAGGDAVTGPSTVIRAIAAGQSAANEIDAAIRARNDELPYVAPPEEEVGVPRLLEGEAEPPPRAFMPEVPVTDRIGDFREVEFGFSKEVALAEACRCLRCDIKDEPA